MAHPQIAIFARLATENATIHRVIAGQKSLLSRTMHDVRYDAIHDEIIVPNPFAQAILVFRGSASGEEAPVRIIQGSNTQLRNPSYLDVDPIHNEIAVADSDRILIYARTGSGNVEPLRVIRGKETRLISADSIAIDPVHNLVVAGTNPSETKGREGPGALIIHDRNSNGNVKPLRYIQGAKSGITRIRQIQIYSPKGWIVAAQAGINEEQEPEGVFVGVWSVNDDGDAPPHWKLGGPHSVMKKPLGVALNAKHRELLVADMRLNSILTFHFPELFQ